MAAIATQPVPDPIEAAETLVDSRSPEWLDAFSAALQHQRAGSELRRITRIWGLSQSEVARRFGVSRQAVAKWLSSGVPENRVETIADLSAATDLLARYVKHDRIPAVVRRPSAAMDGLSLLDLLAAGRHHDVLVACRSMFDFAQARG